MSDQPLVRIPHGTYRRAVEMQQRLYSQNRVKVPIWRCVLMVEEEDKQPKNRDPLWRLRL